LSNRRFWGHMGQDKLLDLVEQIYDAALDESLWSTALSGIADHFGAASCHFLIHDVKTNTPTMHLARTDPMRISEYFQYYVNKNPWIGPFLKLPSGTVTPDDRIYPRDELRHTEFFNDHLRPRQVSHCLGVLVLNTPSLVSSVTIYRTAERGSFDERAIEMGRKLLPHFHRAIQIGQRLGLEQQRGDSAFAALDRMPYGVLLVSAAGRICHANRLAESIINLRDGISIVGGELHASLERDRLAIRQQIAAAIAPGALALAPAVIAVSRPSALRPFEIVISPLRTERSSLFSDAMPRAVVFLTDPERIAEAPAEALQRIYGFTAKEAALTSLLVKGHELSESADILSISLETARTHLKHALAKTETSRQSDLVRIVLSSAARLAVR
jgi:DNA-binding CsgD family transcriptional regulator